MTTATVMSPEERAEKIIRDWMPHLPVFKANPSLGPVPEGSMKDCIAAEIRAAVEEARLKDFEGDDCTVARLEHEAFAKGKADADAANIAERQA